MIPLRLQQLTQRVWRGGPRGGPKNGPDHARRQNQHNHDNSHHNHGDDDDATIATFPDRWESLEKSMLRRMRERTPPDDWEEDTPPAENALWEDVVAGAPAPWLEDIAGEEPTTDHPTNATTQKRQPQTEDEEDDEERWWTERIQGRVEKAAREALGELEAFVESLESDTGNTPAECASATDDGGAPGTLRGLSPDERELVRTNLEDAMVAAAATERGDDEDWEDWEDLDVYDYYTDSYYDDCCYIIDDDQQYQQQQHIDDDTAEWKEASARFRQAVREGIAADIRLCTKLRLSFQLDCRLVGEKVRSAFAS